MAKIGVCDDSLDIARDIAKTVKSSFEALSEECSIYVFQSGAEVLKENLRAPFDVLFLDIDMPGISGFDLARELRAAGDGCLIVFVTSHSELVYDSLDFQPFNFLRKNSAQPLSESVPKTVAKIVDRLKQAKMVLIEERTLGSVPVRLRDIISIESSGHYLVYTVSDGGSTKKLVSRGLISEREELLEGSGFARVHKGFIINFGQLKRLDRSLKEAELFGGVRVPIGKKYRQALEEKYSMYLRRRS